MNVTMPIGGAILIVSSLLIPCAVGAGLPASPQTEKNSAPSREIHLLDLGYNPPKGPSISNREVMSNPTLLMSDRKTRLVFIDENIVALYFSHPEDKSRQDQSAASGDLMEAFFIDANSGTLLSRKTWPTWKRRWFNESYDTQSRIMAVHGGFLVHAGDALHLYSIQMKQENELALDGSAQWSATIAPGGRTIHLIRVDGTSTESQWLSSETLKELHAQHQDDPGPVSASDNAVATKRTECIDLHEFDKTPRHLCCLEPCGYGTPLFLTDEEVISCYSSGFRVMSTTGEVIWGRDADRKTHFLEECKRSMNGSRFVISGHWSRPVVFDGAAIPTGQNHALLVYDALTRTSVFTVMAESSRDSFDFALSPDGRKLAVLTGTVLRLYQIP